MVKMLKTHELPGLRPLGLVPHRGSSPEPRWGPRWALIPRPEKSSSFSFQKHGMYGLLILVYCIVSIPSVLADFISLVMFYVFYNNNIYCMQVIYSPKKIIFPKDEARGNMIFLGE